jgi:hypothetical protein
MLLDSAVRRPHLSNPHPEISHQLASPNVIDQSLPVTNLIGTSLVGAKTSCWEATIGIIGADLTFGTKSRRWGEPATASLAVKGAGPAAL